MSITAKQIAQQLGLSEAAVSMALNNKPGVSTETRALVKEAALNLGYDFTKIKHSKKTFGTICFVIFRKHGAVVSDTPFFNTLSDSVMESSISSGYKFTLQYIIDDNGDVQEQLDHILPADCVGIILLGTEMKREDFFPFAYINLPIVLLDTYFRSEKMDCVKIDNMEGVSIATKHLIAKRRQQPGYLRSTYPIFNFVERFEGFLSAIRANGMSASKSIVHDLSPSMEGAYADMCALLEAKDEIANCYVADNDLIAAGAMKALKEFGYRLPQDVAIIGFDNMPMCTYLSPSLTTINVPIRYMAQTAVNRLINIIQGAKFYPIKIEISTNLIIRKSV